MSFNEGELRKGRHATSGWLRKNMKPIIRTRPGDLTGVAVMMLLASFTGHVQAINDQYNASSNAGQTNIILGEGSAFTLSGGGDLFVLNAGGAETVRVRAGTEAELSGFQGDTGDTLQLPGAAGDYTVSRSGVLVTLVNGATTVVVDAGKETGLQFSNTTLGLGATTGTVELGDQAVTENAAAVTAAGDGAGHEGFVQTPSGSGQRTNVVLGQDASFTLAEGTTNASVFNGEGSETLTLGVGSQVDLSGFQIDTGDTLRLGGAAGDYDISSFGGEVTLTDGTTRITVDAGSSTAFQFKDTTLELAVDTTSGEVKFGSQVVETEASGVTASGNGQGHGNDGIPGIMISDTTELQDTGITWCADGSTHYLDCPVDGFPSQDAQVGRDAQAQAGNLNKEGSGAAGFDFTKLDASGNELEAFDTAWTCVRDNHTGLVWEVKTIDGGLRDESNEYTWYNPDNTTNGGGTQNGGNCSGSDCDTHAYVQAVNAQGLCGASDWRMPTRDELQSIVHHGRVSPAIDTDFFPNTSNASYWSASPSAGLNEAWDVRFYDGKNSGGLTIDLGRVRLVRDGQ